MLALQRTGQRVPEFELAGLSPGCQTLWDTFKELHNARSMSESGANAISWLDLSAWQTVRGVTLTGWELDTLLAMDGVALKTMNEAKK